MFCAIAFTLSIKLGLKSFIGHLYTVGSRMHGYLASVYPNYPTILLVVLLQYFTAGMYVLNLH